MIETPAARGATFGYRLLSQLADDRPLLSIGNRGQPGATAEIPIHQHHLRLQSTGNGTHELRQGWHLAVGDGYGW